MKKRIFTFAVCGMLLCACLFTLSSCFGKADLPKSGEELWERTNSEMNKVDSYETGITMDVTYYYGGYELKVSGEGVGIVIGEQEGSLYYFSENKISASDAEGSYSEEQTAKDVYLDGKYYIHRSGKNYTQRIYSEMTREEVDDYHSGPDKDVGYGKATVKEFTRNDDSTFTLTLSSFPADRMDAMLRYLGISPDIFSHKVIDVKVTMDIGEDYLARRIEAKLVFEQVIDSDEAPSATVIQTYSKFNEATRRETPSDLGEYTRVDSIKVLQEIDDMLSRIERSKDGKFTLTSDQEVDIGGNKATMTEKDIVEYGVGENGYFYDIDTSISMNGEKISYDEQYSGGKVVSKTNGETVTEDCTEEEARYLVYSLINAMRFNSIYVTGVEKLSESEYRIVCDRAEPSEYEAFFEGMGGKLGTASQSMTFTFKDGAISQVSAKIIANGTASDGSMSYITTLRLDVTVVYNRVIE